MCACTSCRQHCLGQWLAGHNFSVYTVVGMTKLKSCSFKITEYWVYQSQWWAFYITHGFFIKLCLEKQFSFTWFSICEQEVGYRLNYLTKSPEWHYLAWLVFTEIVLPRTVSLAGQQRRCRSKVKCQKERIYSRVKLSKTVICCQFFVSQNELIGLV